MCIAKRHVRFTPESGHLPARTACPLWSIPDIKRDHRAIRRHMEDSNSEKFVRAQVYNAANRSVATMAAIRLLSRDKKLLIRVATNTKIAETLTFAKFKYDQSTDTFWLRFIIVDEDALRASGVRKDGWYLRLRNHPRVGLSGAQYQTDV